MMAGDREAVELAADMARLEAELEDEQQLIAEGDFPAVFAPPSRPHGGDDDDEEEEVTLFHRRFTRLLPSTSKADVTRSKFLVQETRMRNLVQEIGPCVRSSPMSFISYEKLRTILYEKLGVT